MKRETKATDRSRRKTVWSLIGAVLLTAFLALSAVLFFSARWLSDVWPDLLPEELVYHIKAPLAGTSPEMIAYYITHYAIPEVLVTAAAIALLILAWREGRPLYRGRKWILLGIAALAVAGIGGAVQHMESCFGLVSYLNEQRHPDTFIEDNYVDPKDVSLRFPEKKRNLIYIYLESLETTFSGKASGGAFQKDCIPELTELALENECFNGGSGKLNGGVPLSGTGWTMGAIFGQSTGLPLKISISGNDMGTQGDFFPSVAALGDILEDAGYTNDFLLGSNVEFGGRKLFFAEHGDFRMLDYIYAKEQGWIPENYKVWWGYEDERLFTFAREHLAELAESDEPFNLTLLTVDTHFEDGYVCRLCGDEFGDNRYANVFACSSRQTVDFVRWVQQQDFYDDTTIILAGDHLTMDADFCEDVPEDYERKVYFSVINGAPAARGGDAMRDFSTFDLFPTTLAALGVEIEGNRLGLGTNLYSDVETLTERFGLSECRQRLARRSEMLESLTEIRLTDALLDTLRTNASLDVDPERGGHSAIHAKELYNCREIDDIRCIEVECRNADKPEESPRRVTLSSYNREDGHYADFTEQDIPFRALEVVEQVVKTDGSSVPLRAFSGPLSTDDLCEYLTNLCSGGDRIVFVAACDDASASLNDEVAALMRQIGAMQDLRGRFRAGYALVADLSGRRSAPILEAYDVYGRVEAAGWVDGISYAVTSAGYGSGSAASITINGEQYAVGGRGLNFVVYDRTLRLVVSSVCFDTYDPAFTASR